MVYIQYILIRLYDPPIISFCSSWLSFTALRTRLGRRVLSFFCFGRTAVFAVVNQLHIKYDEIQLVTFDRQSRSWCLRSSKLLHVSTDG